MSDQLPFRIRRSAVEGKRPQTTDLELGELALNTFDARLFAKRDTGGVGIGTTVALLTPWTENVGGGLYYNEGNVGLGTTNPTTKLWVSGDINFTGNLYQNGNIFQSGGDGTSSQWTTYPTGISTTSNVGIGTTNPTSKLQINGSVTLGAGSTDLITIPGRIASNFYPTGDGVYDIGRPTQIGLGANRWKDANFSGKGSFDSGVDAHDIEIGVGSANLIYSTFGNLELNSQSGKTNIDDNVTISGNTGIGTSTPTSKLHVVGNANISGIITTTSINFSSGGLLGDPYEDGGFGLKSAANQVAIIASNNLQQYIQVDDNQIFIGTGYGSTTGSYDWKFDKNGALTFSDSTVQTTAFTGYANTAGIASYATNAGVSTYAITAGIATTATTALGFSTTASINTSGIITASSFTGNLSGTATTANNLSDAANITTGTISSSRLTGSYGISITGTATTATNLSDAANITTGTISSSRLSGTYGIDITGTATTATNLSDAANITTGTISSSRLSGTYGIDIIGTATTATNLSDAANITTGTIDKDRISNTNSLTVLGDLYVSNNISFGGSTTQLNTQQLQIVDSDIVLGIGTSFSPTDNTANHGGIAIASTEGTPLVNLNIVPEETNPSTYKKIMWFKGDTIGAGLTDAWLFNYGVGIGSTQVPYGVRLAVGQIQMTDSSITATTFNGNLNGTATTATNLSDAANIITGTISSSRLSGSYGIDITGTATTATNLENAANITTGTISSSRLSGTYGISITGTATTATNLSDAANITTGTISSSRLSGTYGIDITGTATTATNLENAANITTGTISSSRLSGTYGISIIGTATTATNLEDAANITTGTISSSRLSGTYGISITGTATTATNLSDAANITTGTISSSRLSGSYGIDIIGTATTATTANNVSSTIDINTSGIITASSFTGNLTGTATTATNLSNAANITTGTISSSRLTGTYGISITGTATTATNLSNAANITTGTISSSRLSGTYGISITGTATTATNLSDAANITTGTISSSRLSGSYGISITGTATTATNLSDAANITTGTISSSRLSGSYGISITGTATTATNLSNAANITTGTISSSRLSGSYGISITGTATTATTALGFSTTASINTTGIITATRFSGDGSTLTGINASQWTTHPAGISTTSNVGIGTTNPGSKLTVNGAVQIQQDSGSNNRFILRGQPASSYRWNVDNFGSANDFRIFREDDTTAANGVVAVSISTTGTISATKFSGDGSLLTGITASGSGVAIQNQGSNVGTASTINFSTNLIASFSSGTATISLSNNPSISGILTADQVYTSNNGNGQNVRIGDDFWLGDVNVSNTARFSGAQDSTKAFIIFGSSDAVALGRTGTGPLYYGGDFTSAGIITATQLDLSANASTDDSVLYLSGIPLGTSTKNGLLGIGQLSFSDTDIVANFTHNVNGYAQVVLQNKNSGASASSDFIVNNDRTAGTTYYGDFGINGTTFSGGGPFGDPDGTYLYAAGGTLTLGSLDAYALKLATNNTERLRIDGTNVGIGTTVPTSTLHVQGDARITGIVTATSFVGDGSQLTGITGGSIDLLEVMLFT